MLERIKFKSMPGALLSIATACLMVMLTAGYSPATTVVKKSLSTMAVESALIVEGVVVGKQSVWNETHQYIITEVYIEVTYSYKGKSTRYITVRVLGGVIGDVGMHVSGSPNFEVADEVLLMLEKHPRRDWRVVGFHQGKFNISTDSHSGQKTVRGPAQPQAMALTDFEARLQGLIKGKQP